MATTLTPFPAELTTAATEPGAQMQAVASASEQDAQTLSTSISFNKLESPIPGTDLSIFERQVFQLLRDSPIRGPTTTTATATISPFPDSFAELDKHESGVVGPTVDEIFSPSYPPLSEFPQAPELEFRSSSAITGGLECASPTPSAQLLPPLPPPPAQESDDEEDERRAGPIVGAGISSERVIKALGMESRLETVVASTEGEGEIHDVMVRARRRAVTALDGVGEGETPVGINVEGVREGRGQMGASRIMEPSYAMMHRGIMRSWPASTISMTRSMERSNVSRGEQDATMIHTPRILTRGGSMAGEEIIRAPQMLSRSYARMGSPKPIPAPIPIAAPTPAPAPTPANSTDIPAGSLCPPPPRTYITMNGPSANLLEKKLQEMDETVRRNQAIREEQRLVAELAAAQAIAESRTRSRGLGSIRSKFTGLLKMRRRSRSNHSSGSSSGSVATPESRQALFQRVDKERTGESESESPVVSNSNSGSRRSSVLGKFRRK